MHITEFLMKYRTPMVFNAEGGGGEGAAPAGGDAAPAGGEGAAAPAGDGAPAAPEGGETLLTGTGDEGAGDPPPEGGEGGEGEGTGDEAQGDGEAGEFSIAPPEGMENFQPDFEKFSSEAQAWLSENKQATPADALKWAAERQADLVSQNATEVQEAFTQQVTGWEAAVESDAELGGAHHGENMAIAKGTIDAFGTDGLKQVLGESGLGSHPEFVRLAFKIGKALQEGPVLKPTGAQGSKSFASTLYPDKK